VFVNKNGLGYSPNFGTRGSEVQILSPRPIVFNRLRFCKSSKLSPWCAFYGCPNLSIDFNKG